MTITYDLSDIEEIADKVLKESTTNTLLFYGDIGVGKTTLIKFLSKELGVEETIQSPTFSIVNKYIGKDDLIIYHFDCYRVEHPEEILDIGFEEYLMDGDWIFIEWPEKITEFLPKKSTFVTIEHLSKGERKLTLT